MGKWEADRMAEMPADFRKVAGGTGKKKGRKRHASTVGKGQPKATI
jgi:hypothetical protein